jgi:hypothetical protein
MEWIGVVLSTDQWYVGLSITTVTIIVMLFLLLTNAHGGMSSDEWFQLVVTIEKHQDKLDVEERQFIRNVINRLTVEEKVIPTPEHQHWLLNIKKKLGL